MNAEPNRLDIHLHLPSGTILRVLVAVLAVWATLRLWPEFIFLSLSLLLAVALHPLAARLEGRGMSRGTAVMLIAAGMVALAVALLAVVFTALARAAETGSERAVEAVLQGEKHPWEGPSGNIVSPWSPGAPPAERKKDG